MSEQQSEMQWDPIPPKPRNSGRVWMILGLVVVAAVIVGVLLFLLIPRGESAEPGASASPSASASPTATLTPGAEPEPTTPVTTPPPATDPTIEAFRDRVAVWLDSAPTGLDIISESSGDEALSVIETLQADAQRLAESAAPSSIGTAWNDGVALYNESLSELRSAVESDTEVGPAVESARSAANDLRVIVGL